MSVESKGRAIAAKFATSDWFRRLGPRILPPLHRFMARASGGRWHPGATIILTTTGARSGLQRQTPLEAVVRDDGTFVIVGSNFAGDSHPAWSWNLMAHPQATVLWRGEERDVLATLLEGESRAGAWEEALTRWPAWDDYTEVTDRTFRIFHLVPTG